MEERLFFGETVLQNIAEERGCTEPPSLVLLASSPSATGAESWGQT